MTLQAGAPGGLSRSDPIVTSRTLQGLSLWLAVFAVPALLFLVGALSHIHVPGAYMDAVNPDYLVVRLLHHSAVETPVWLLPGALFADRFPLIGQVYHGALPFYAGLPAYALFGTGLVGIRIANATFGLMVLAGAAGFLLAFRVRPVIAAAGLALIALDPGFVFAFRTQFYITLLPLALTMTAVALAEHRRPTVWLALGTGALAGLAVWGYFIYLFLLPTAFLHMALRWRRPGLALTWIVGVAIGGSLYLIGFAAIVVATGGIAASIAFLGPYFAALSVHSGDAVPMAARVALFIKFTQWTMLDIGPAAMLVQTAVATTFADAKLVLTILLPLACLLLSLAMRRFMPGLLVLAGFVAGVFGILLTFGDRVWLHHTIMLLPILYCAAAASIEWVALQVLPLRRRAAMAVVVVLLAPLLIGNAIDTQAFIRRLQTTGGVGLASDAISRFAEDTLKDTVPEIIYLPDWGVFMSFVMITEGKVPNITDFKPAVIVKTICEGRDAVLATMADKPPERLAGWRESVHSPFQTATYRQHDGTPILEVTRWRAAAVPPGLCAKPAPPPA